MQIKSLRLKSSKSFPIADTESEEASARLKKLELFDQLRAQCCSVALSLQAIFWSKATYFFCPIIPLHDGTKHLDSVVTRC